VKGVKLADGREFTARSVIALPSFKVLWKWLRLAKWPGNLLTVSAMAASNRPGLRAAQGEIVALGWSDFPCRASNKARGDGVGTPFAKGPACCNRQRGSRPAGKL